jgi:hypothetical protein
LVGIPHNEGVIEKRAQAGYVLKKAAASRDEHMAIPQSPPKRRGTHPWERVYAVQALRLRWVGRKNCEFHGVPWAPLAEAMQDAGKYRFIPDVAASVISR